MANTHLRPLSQFSQFNIPKINFLPLALQRDVAGAEQLAILFDGGVEARDHAAANLWFGVLQHRIAVDEVGDQRIAQDNQFGFDPLLALIGLGSGFYAVPRVNFSFKHHIRAGGTHVASGAGLAVAQTCEELHFHRNGPVLFAGHGAWVLGVEHHTAVFERITRRIRTPLAHKAVFHRQVVIRKRRFEIQVPKTVVEFVVLVVAHLYHSVFHTEGIAVVVAHLVVVYLDDPIRKVFPVEKGNPPFWVLPVFGSAASAEGQ